MPSDDRYVATTITTKVRQRLRAFKTRVIQSGLPDGIVAPSALTISSTIDLALDIAELAMKKRGRLESK